MHKEFNSRWLILQLVSNWKHKGFTLGANLASERFERLPEGISFEILNTNEPFTTEKIREYYLNLYLGFWVVTIGFRI